MNQTQVIAAMIAAGLIAVTFWPRKAAANVPAAKPTDWRPPLIPWAPALPKQPPPSPLLESIMETWKTPAVGLKYEADFIAASVANGLPEGLLSRVAWQESRYDSNAQSPAGAMGIMQIVPRWHPGVDPMNPKEAIPYAAKFLADNYRRFGSWDKALAAYNWGPTAVARAIADAGNSWLSLAPAETKNYVADVTTDVPNAVA